jgi:tetratricopeptide (TPR) repeat protein
LAGVLWPLLGWHGCYIEELAIGRLGVRAARACGDAPAEARMLAGVGSALRQLGRTTAAAGPLRSAARIWLDLGYDHQLAATLRELGRISAARGRHAEAISYFTQAQRLCQRGEQAPSLAGQP